MLFRSRPGTCVSAAADSILRADVRSGDTVVWGLTCPGRVEVADGLDLEPHGVDKYAKLPREKQYWTLDYFSSSTMVLAQMREIAQVMNFCDKLGVGLYIANILDISWMPLVLRSYSRFVDFTQDPSGVDGYLAKFVDFGTDHSHPGPQQHRLYADRIFNLIKENNHGTTL